MASSFPGRRLRYDCQYRHQYHRPAMVSRNQRSRMRRFMPIQLMISRRAVCFLLIIAAFCGLILLPLPLYHGAHFEVFVPRWRGDHGEKQRPRRHQSMERRAPTTSSPMTARFPRMAPPPILTVSIMAKIPPAALSQYRLPLPPGGGSGDASVYRPRQRRRHRRQQRQDT